MIPIKTFGNLDRLPRNNAGTRVACIKVGNFFEKFFLVPASDEKWTKNDPED